MKNKPLIIAGGVILCLVNLACGIWNLTDYLGPHNYYMAAITLFFGAYFGSQTYILYDMGKHSENY